MYSALVLCATLMNNLLKGLSLAFGYCIVHIAICGYLVVISCSLLKSDYIYIYIYIVVSILVLVAYIGVAAKLNTDYV